MRYTRIHFHHFPGHDHSRGCCHDEVVQARRTKEDVLALIERLSQQGDEAYGELAECRGELDDQAAAGYLAEGMLFLRRSNAKLEDAAAALKRG